MRQRKKGTLKVVGFLTLAISMLVALSMAIPVQAAPDVKEWRVPWICFFSGPYAQFGGLLKIGMVEAVEDINAAGGISGKPVVVEYRDDATDAAKAVAEMSQVVNDSLVVMGPLYAPSAKAALPMAARQGVPCLIMTAGPQIVKQFYPWASGMVPDAKDFGPAAAGWAKRHPSLKSVVQFVWPEDPTWMEIAKAHTDALKKRGIKVKDVEVSGGIDMGSVAIKALSNKPDGFVISVGAVETAKIIKELDKRGVKDKSKILIFVSADFADLYNIGKGFLDGANIYSGVNPYSENPRWKALMKKVATKYPDLIDPPAWALSFPYDTLLMIKAAIEHEKITGDPNKLSDERKRIRDYVNNIKKFQGVNDTFSMVNGLPKVPLYLYEIKDNRKVLLERYDPK
jgi:branched-chain amino acid transport system substrate-binding protein